MSFIKKIKIKNFKNLEDVEVDIKPLTFLFGPNGSGKSTFIQALMFLSNNINQCFSDYGGDKTKYILDNGSNLGSYKDLVTNNDSTKEISFEINIQGEFEFFKKEIFNTPFEEDEMETEDFLKNTDVSYNYNNIFNSFTGQNEGEEEYLCNKDFNFNCYINFVENENNYNLKSYIVYDNINKFELQFNFDTNFGDIIARRFICLDNKSVSIYFKTWLDYDYYQWTSINRSS